MKGRSFGVDASGPARFNLNRLGPVLEEVHERLSGVVIERLPWGDFIDRYDHAGTLFYLDPPYYGYETDYGKNVFYRSEFDRIAEKLGSINGRFIVSLNDRPEVREIFSAFKVYDVSLTYTLGSGKAKPVREVLITDQKHPFVPNMP